MLCFFLFLYTKGILTASSFLSFYKIQTSEMQWHIQQTRNWHIGSNFTFGRIIETIGCSTYYQSHFLNLLVLPQAAVAAPALPPTTITAAASNVPPAVPSPAAAQAPSPMQYGIGPGFTFVNNDPRNSGIDRRKRK